MAAQFIFAMHKVSRFHPPDRDVLKDDVKWLVETICTTEAYQRESRPRSPGGGGVPFAASVPQPLRADQLYNVVLSALDLPEDTSAARRGGGTYGPVGGPRTQFNVTFGYDPSDPRESVSGSIPQVLAMMNSPKTAGGLRANRKSLLGALVHDIRNDEQLCTELYLRTLSRQPTEDELARSRAYLDEVGKRAEAAEDLMWALMNSAEFRHRR